MAKLLRPTHTISFGIARLCLFAVPFALAVGVIAMTVYLVLHGGDDDGIGIVAVTAFAMAAALGGIVFIFMLLGIALYAFIELMELDK